MFNDYDNTKYIIQRHAEENFNYDNYTRAIPELFTDEVKKGIDKLVEDLFHLWTIDKGCIFIAGNGGSAANAEHFSNDLTYGIANHKSESKFQYGIRNECLSSNSAIISCLSNDIGYDNIFGYQLKTKMRCNDILLCISGSGNSDNILNALQICKSIGGKSYSMLGFDGGKALELSDNIIHFICNDMQLSEDCHLIAGHLISKKLKLMASK